MSYLPTTWSRSAAPAQAFFGVTDQSGASIMDEATTSMKVKIVAGSGGVSHQDDTPFTVGTDSLTPVGYLADETGTDSVNEGDVGIGRMTLDRLPYAQVGASAGAQGCITHRTAALVATAVAVKASAGRIYGYHISSVNAVITYLHVYNIAAASVVVGTSTPIITLALPAGAVLDGVFPLPISDFDTAIAIAATTTITGNTAPSTGLLVNIWYR